MQNTSTLIDKVKIVGLVVNKGKTKVTELLGNNQEILAVEELVFEKVDQF